MIQIPGIGGSGSRLISGGYIGSYSNSLACDTLFEYRGEFIVNGTFFIPKTAGVLLGWRY